MLYATRSLLSDILLPLVVRPQTAVPRRYFSPRFARAVSFRERLAAVLLSETHVA